VIEYEVAHAHPSLATAPAGDVSEGLREAVRRGAATDDWVYRDACVALGEARTMFWTAMSDIDALIFPAAPDVAPAGMKTGDPRFIVPFTALDGPMVSVPVGYGAQDLPLGLCCSARPGPTLRSPISPTGWRLSSRLRADRA